jgi:hypothetical protein
MFKRYRLATFPPEETGVIFRTSGTTGEVRGEHHFKTTLLYEASILAGWRRLALPELPTLVLTPTPAQAPHSSLAYMMGTLAAQHREPVRFVTLDDDALRTIGDEPVALLGTALAFLHWFERMGDRSLALPPGSFAMETGGYKGSGREIPKSELYALFAARLGLPADAVWNEYGMTELSSQAYTSGLERPHAAPPWLRGVVIDPETGGEVADGEIGALRLFDLANLGSVLALQTRDLARRAGDAFFLIGRDPGALPRGCSRAADEALSRA